MKKCCTCKQFLSKDEFYPRNKKRPDVLQSQCKKCIGLAVMARRRKCKLILVDMFGGECSICGYDKCVQALQFHHIDASKKEFGIFQNGSTQSIEKLVAEAKKCIMVCANCHAEIHAGLITTGK